MNRHDQSLEFNTIKQQLQNYCLTDEAKEMASELQPFMSVKEVREHQKNTSESRKILDQIGQPPIVSMTDVKRYILTAKQGGLLFPEELEAIAGVLTATKRLIDFLNRCKILEISLAYTDEKLHELEDLRQRIQQSIRGGRVDDYATKELQDIRKAMENTEQKMKVKAEGILRTNKSYCTESFLVTRNGRLCIPLKKEHKMRVTGSVVDQSSTGATIFVEPAAVASIGQELEILRMEEENEVRNILYTLTAYVGDYADVLEENRKVIIWLDFIFAKGKLSADMDGVEPELNTEHHVVIESGRHPLMNKEKAVPLNVSFGKEYRGIIITGPNTGGKTVSIKTIGIFSLMAQSGLHVPCKKANMAMQNQVLCDIGDGQNITENLSTFSAHMKNILSILEQTTNKTLVILDELGSGTDPVEGMGIAIAVIEELILRECTFLVTTHYAKVKEYGEQNESIMNARMAFDPESLQPLYQLEVGKSGESCALHIAKRLGMPDYLIQRAYEQAYGKQVGREQIAEENVDGEQVVLEKTGGEKQVTGENRSVELVRSGSKNTTVQGKVPVPRLEKELPKKQIPKKIDKFQIGDSVMVYPDHKIGIVCKKANDRGEYTILFKDKKIVVSHKRLKLWVAAEELYPEDYDFSIVFDSVATRKARHQMSRKYTETMTIKVED